MRDLTILKEDGFLGPHSPRLHVGDTQLLIFKDNDSGPFYLSPEQRELQRHDRPTGKHKRVERSKSCLSNLSKKLEFCFNNNEAAQKRASRVCEV